MAVVKRRGADFDDYAQAFRFRVTFTEISSTPISFARVSGITSSVDVVEYREGDDPITNLKFPGLVTFDNVTFERGIVKGDLALVDFFQAVVDLQKLTAPDVLAIGEFVVKPVNGKIRTDIQIDIFSRNLTKFMRSIILKRAFPVELTIGDLDASSGDILIETLVVAHEGYLIREAAASSGPAPSGTV